MRFQRCGNCGRSCRRSRFCRKVFVRRPTARRRLRSDPRRKLLLLFTAMARLPTCISHSALGREGQRSM